ncbi:MAG: hypothetical protein WC385_01935 [Candidatus Paceibacterota bacterium]|jgi:hypothetical protein
MKNKIAAKLSDSQYQANVDAVWAILLKEPLVLEVLAKKVRKKKSGYNCRGHGAVELKTELRIMLYQNPERFMAEEFGQLTLWKANPAFKQAVPQPQKLVKNFGYASDRNALVRQVLEKFDFEVSYTKLWQEVLAEAKRQDFDPHLLSEDFVRKGISIYLAILVGRGAIRLIEMGEKIVPKDLSLLDRSSISPPKVREEEEPDFNDPAVIEAELKREQAEREARGLPVEEEGALDDEEEILAEEADDELPEAIRRRLNELTEKIDLSQIPA